MTSEDVIQAVRAIVAAALGWGPLDPEDADYNTATDPANRLIPAKDKGPRPALGYLTVDVVTHGVVIGMDETLYDLDKDGGLTTTASGDRIDRVQIDAFGDEAEEWLSSLILLLGQEPAQAAARTAGVAMTNLTGPRVLATLRDSSFESRWSADFQVGYWVASEPATADSAKSVSVGIAIEPDSIDITAALES